MSPSSTPTVECGVGVGAIVGPTYPRQLGHVLMDAITLQAGNNEIGTLRRRRNICIRGPGRWVDL